MTKCFCVGSVLHFITATALLVCVIVNVCQVKTNKKKCMEFYEFPDDVKIFPSHINMDREKMEHMREGHENIGNMEEMRRKMMIRNKMAKYELRKHFANHENYERAKMEFKCAIAHYDHQNNVYQISLWATIGFNVFMTYIVGILGSGVYCSAVGHRKLGLKIATIVIFIQQLFVLLGSALLTLKFTLEFMSRNEYAEHFSSYFKGRVAVDFIMLSILAVSWIIHLVHSFAACCCTPTEDEETIKIVKVNKSASEDRLKLVDNVVFGERVFDNDGEIA